MKRAILSLLLLATVVSGLMAQSDAMYIYRNDGVINAFLKTDIDSIRHSFLDLDSVMHSENVTQEVWTVDSVYRIPLTAIDSVSFVTPETKYKQNVIRLEEDLMEYVLRQDSLTIFFSSSLPSAIKPRVGDKLVTLEMSDVLPIGFAGEVTEVKNSSDEVEVVCTAVSLEDVFECYYGYTEMGWDGKNLVRSNYHDSRRKAEGTFAPGKLTLNLINNQGFTNSYVPNDELSGDFSELRSDISVTPVVWGSAFVIVNPFYGVNVSLTVTGNYNLEENFTLKGGLSWKKDITLPYPYDRVFWPIAPLVDVYIKPGMFVQAGGEFAIQQQWTQEYRSIFHYEYSSRGEQLMDNVNKLIPVSSGHSGEAALKGYIGAGFFLEVGFDFIHTKKADLANVNLRAEAGVNLEGSLVLTKSDMENAMKSTAVYEQLRDTEVSLNWFYGLSANAQFWKWSVSHDVNLPGLKLNNQGKIFSMALAPTFSDVKATRIGGATDVNAEASISCPDLLGGRCLKVDVGFVLKDEEGNDVTPRSYNISGYNGSGGTKEMNHQFSNVPSDGKKLKVYPHIKWMGVDILASPSADVEDIYYTCPDDHHPHAIDLGLPSGTKWCCCNVGASTPEGYGGYYAWGETSEKSYYGPSTYKYAVLGDSNAFWYDNGHYYRSTNIGSDIAGTSYDVAHVRMGASWRMPSHDQQMELMNNCSRQWTQQNGVNGILVTGPSGGQVFLPAAGSRWYVEHYGAGSYGFYWSSSLDPADDYGAYGLYFNSGYWNWLNGYRDIGLSVRAVRP